MQDKVDVLRRTIDDVAGSHTDQAISASRPVNDLLEVWELAHAIDGSVAEPVEALLTALVGRELTTATELQATLDEVRSALDRVLEGASS